MKSSALAVAPADAPAVAYRIFLEGKISLAPSQGFDVDPDEVNPSGKPHCRLIVPWSLKGGRRAVFASFGLHKTWIQIERHRLALRSGRGPSLITLPLGVRREFFREAEARFTGEHAVKMRFIRRTDEADEGSINLTNYESVREGKVDPRGFGICDLDEASCLRAFGGSKTFREFMRLFENVPLRGVNTATPSPNEYIELLAYAAFLGIMDVGQAKTRFFKRDSEHADRLTLHDHKAREFWLWVASWAIFIQKPSDLGFSDEGYELPPLDVRWHELPSDHRGAGTEKSGQGRLIRDAAIGVSEAAAERRDSLEARMEKVKEIIAEEPDEHRLLWHDLEAERVALEATVPGIVTIHGTLDLESREKRVTDFAEGRTRFFGTKPILSGSGGNLQYHCARGLYTGIGFKFNDFIQSIHRIRRFGQTRGCRIDLIHTEAERKIRDELQRRWRQHDAQAAIMAGIIREYGLAESALAQSLQRSIGVARKEWSGEHYRIVNNDSVEEIKGQPDNSVDLIVTSIPFSTQYEYTPSYNDFGHSDSDAQFWAQMDYLTPELLRVLKPGRVAAIHVKDRIVPGGLTGLGFQTVSPFSDDCSTHFRRHGFALLCRKTIVTDVVRENNQTYRLGWTEQCKDGSRMGAGMPEYLLLFRKPPSDNSDGYADAPVVKDKAAYTRGRWQLDAHGFERVSGDRLLAPADLKGLPKHVIYKLFKKHSLTRTYDFEHHVAICDAVDADGRLPTTFMLMPPQSWHPDVWTDVTRMRTLNGAQQQSRRQQHLCPLQFDIVDRAIVQFSQPGETVFDPFNGIGTVPYCALKLGRQGLGFELNPDYARDAVFHCAAAEKQRDVPTLFGLDALAQAGDEVPEEIEESVG